MMFVNIYHGRASFELNVEIGKIAEPNERVRIEDIVAWAGAEQAEGFGQHTVFQVSSRDGVQQFVPKLAELVKKYGTPLLRDDPQAYTSIRRSCDARAQRYMKQMELERVRPQAEAAWHNKDYARVVNLYRSIQDDLSESEAMKLAYAEKQLLLSHISDNSPN